jgi:phosphoenolpyruvate carboxylase
MDRTNDRDAPLAEDIRLLGRLLGDTIRAYEGEFTFDLIETIRRLAVASRRLEDIASRRSLAQTLDALTDDQAVLVVRAFSYFSLLANIAEDRHHIRRHRALRREGGNDLLRRDGQMIAVSRVILQIYTRPRVLRVTRDFRRSVGTNSEDWNPA